MRTRPAQIVVAVIAAVLLFDALAPVQLGGRVSYVNVRGISMEPTLQTGDLLMMRQHDQYEIGQVVAFRSDMGGAVIVHRIVDKVGDQYLLKGDNNTFIDRFTPTVDEIIGAEVFAIAGGERLAIAAASLPAVTLKAALLLTALLFWRNARLVETERRRAARRRSAAHSLVGSA